MNHSIYHEVEKLVRRYQTRDPFELLDALHVVVGETSSFKSLKGYCFMSCKTIYVMISSFLTPEQKRIVAAHELGHIVLHKQQLKLAPMQESVLYDMKEHTEYEANLFAADLLLTDQDVEENASNPDLNYFSLCTSLNATPELMSFKLYSLIHRGHAYNMPLGLDNTFLQ